MGRIRTRQGKPFLRLAPESLNIIVIFFFEVFDEFGPSFS